MSRTFTLDEVNALELSAADNATILERERIIKLLEEHTINGKHGVTPHGNSHFWEMGMKYAIALIKGDDFCRHLIALIKGEQK